jgi:hypothetical protein
MQVYLHKISHTATAKCRRPTSMLKSRLSVTFFNIFSGYLKHVVTDGKALSLVIWYYSQNLTISVETIVPTSSEKSGLTDMDDE